MDVRGLRKALIGLSAALAVVVGAAAHAAPVVGVSVDTVVADPNNPDHYGVDEAASGPAPDGNYLLSGIGYGANFQCNWDLTLNPDPQITSTFTLKNLSANTQTFIMTITLPIAAIGPTTVQGGYFGDPVTGTTFTDTSGDANVTLATVGATKFYQALVNGALSKDLGSFSSSAAVSGSIPQAQWGTPIPSAPFGPASGNIQIKWTFSLTGGDTVQTKGFFQVEPEPSEVLLLGMGFAALASLVAARRRST